MTEQTLLSAAFERRSALVTRRIAGETVLVPVAGPLAGGAFLFTLNETSTFLWERLDGRRTGWDLVKELQASYEVAGSQAEADVLLFLEQLREIEAVQLQ